MNLRISRTGLSEILPLREIFLKENFYQIRYDAVHRRGWSDSYLFELDDKPIGYGSIKGNDRFEDRDTVFEYFLVAEYRGQGSGIFSSLLAASGAKHVDCQSNEPLITAMLHEFCEEIRSYVILFEDGVVADLHVDGAVFRKKMSTDKVFEHSAEPEGDFVVSIENQVVATGGFLLHYNFPFADIYMEVKENFRQQGIGSYLVQEVGKQCHLAGRIPAARTSVDNLASKNTLLKAGMKIAGYMMFGQVKHQKQSSIT